MIPDPQPNTLSTGDPSLLAHPRMTATSLYVCNNSEIISVLGRCNGEADCLDASDEKGCLAVSGKQQPTCGGSTII